MYLWYKNITLIKDPARPKIRDAIKVNVSPSPIRSLENCKIGRKRNIRVSNKITPRITRRFFSIIQLDNKSPEMNNPKPIHKKNSDSFAKTPINSGADEIRLEGLENAWFTETSADILEAPRNRPIIRTNEPATEENNRTYEVSSNLGRDRVSRSRSKPRITKAIPKIAKVTVIACSSKLKSARNAQERNSRPGIPRANFEYLWSNINMLRYLPNTA